MLSQSVRRAAVPRHSFGHVTVAGLVLIGAIGLSGCGTASRNRHEVLVVPGEYATIQAAVDHAVPGDLVLISPGVYREAVVSHVPDLDIRGRDRNTVVIDGSNRLPNGITLAANGDSVENLTVRRFAINGLLFTLSDNYGNGSVLHGYRASYVTAYDNGLYGLYAFGATGGLFDHDYASGQPDSGIYIGQCRPCNAVVEHSMAESNRVGFEAANASGGLTIVDSQFDSNRAGVVVESDTTEKLLPQVGAVIAGNVIANNNNPVTPTTSEGADVFGYGIAIGGGSNDSVLRNLVTGNVSVGVIVTGGAGYSPKNDKVSGNALSGNRVDLVYAGIGSDTIATRGNCFSGNSFSSSDPTAIESTVACGHDGVVRSSFAGAESPDGVDYTTIAPPPAMPEMVAAATAPASPAADEPPAVNFSSVVLPAS